MQREFDWQIAFLVMLLTTLFCCESNAAQTVSLAWDASPDTNVVGYAVYYGTASGAYDSRLDVGTNTSATVTGLARGLTYFFVATAYDADGLESDPSNEVSFDVPGVADLAISMSASPNWVDSGSNVIFTIYVTNTGPDAAGSVTVSNALPAGLNFVDTIASQGAVTIASGLVIFLLGSIYSGAQATLTLTASPISSGWLTNTASVSTSTIETNLTNNVAFAIILVGTNGAPTLQISTQSGGTVQLSWAATVGQNYQVQYKTDLAQTNWSNLGGVVTATDNSAIISDNIGPDRQRYYRVGMLPSSAFRSQPLKPVSFFWHLY